MNKEEIERNIKSLLAKMSGHSSNSDINNLIESCSLSVDISEIQELIAVWKYLNSNEPTEAVEVEEPKIEDSVSEEPVMEETPIIEDVQEEEEQEVVEDTTTNDEGSSQENIEEQAQPEAETAEETSSIEEEPSESERSINDQLESQSEENSVANQLGSQPIASLSQAIGINERFLFTKELFNNDSQAYVAAIEKLNNFETLEEARSYINSDLKSNYTWDEESEAVSSLINLVEKRYSN